MTTLVSFLGLGRKIPGSDEYCYETVRYASPDDPGRGLESCYVAHAIAELMGASDIHLIATEEAWRAHGEALGEKLQGRRLSRSIIPSGKNETELREQFRILREALALAKESSSLLVDITHGFRTQPFFAASALAVLLASGDLPEDTRILYGAFEAGEPGKNESLRHVPIWDLSPFLLLQRMAFGIATFMQTGHADALVRALREEEERLRQRTLKGRRDAFPSGAVNTLTGAIERFARDLSCLRVPALTIGGEKDGNPTPSSSRLLVQALRAYEEQEKDDLIAIRPLLDDMRAMAGKLQAETLFGPEGQRVMAELGRLYLTFHRHAEAAGLGAEALISRYARGPEATDAGRESFSRGAREEASRLCSAALVNRDKLDIRNDLLHAGFRASPAPADAMQDNVAKLISTISEPPRTIFVTRHAGAREWARRRGVIVDEMLDHLEPDMARPGDLVIGSLPIHLVAEINRRGARYKHLSIDIPPEKRGAELSADEMEKYGARLEEFRIETIPGPEKTT